MAGELMGGFMALLRWQRLSGWRGPVHLQREYRQKSLRRKASQAGVIAGLAGEIRMRPLAHIRFGASIGQSGKTGDEPQCTIQRSASPSFRLIA
jgi:hypothetical protein